MFVLYPRDPDRVQIGKVWRMPNEVSVVRKDRYIVCHHETTASYLKRNGFVDVTMASLKDAAKLLGVTTTAVRKLMEGGQLTSFGPSDGPCCIPVREVQTLLTSKEGGLL